MTENQPKNIIIRFPNWVGDVVMAMPALETIRRSFPAAHVTLALKAHLGEIAEGSPWFNSLLLFRSAATGLETALAGCSAVRGREYDLGITLPDSFSSALFLRLVRARRRIGYAGHGRSWLLTDAVPRPRANLNMVDRYLYLCQHLRLEPTGSRPQLFVTPREEAEAARLFSRHHLPEQNVIALAPGASFGPSKLWRNDYWAETADRLSTELSARIVLIGAPWEKPLLQEIAQKAKCSVVILANDGVSLGVLKGVLRRCSLLIATDSGPRQYAVAFGRPVVVLMGPNDPSVTAINLERQKVLRADVQCSPCRKKVCPSDHRCMELITPAMVCAAVRELLATCA